MEERRTPRPVKDPPLTQEVSNADPASSRSEDPRQAAAANAATGLEVRGAMQQARRSQVGPADPLGGPKAGPLSCQV